MSKVLSHRHAFHLVDPSPWPFIASFAGLTLTSGAVMWMHGYINGFTVLFMGQLLILSCMYVWWRDVVREATFEGQHTALVQTGMRTGVILFIVSEVMFFLGFFWAFFHSSLAPMPDIGGVWPPVGIDPLSPWEVPLLNTVILLSSGATVTYAHHAILAGDRKNSLLGLIYTIVLAAIFTALQGYEYLEAPFTIADSVYGACFFMATGFHGAHVLIGTIFLFVCLMRLVFHHFTAEHHFGLEAAIFYWHFLDVVCVLLFVAIYWWGGV